MVKAKGRVEAKKQPKVNSKATLKAKEASSSSASRSGSKKPGFVSRWTSHFFQFWKGAEAKAKPKSKAGAKAKPTTEASRMSQTCACPVSSAEFLQHADQHTFDLTMKPAQFSSGGFGWKLHDNIKINAGRALGCKEVLVSMTCNANVRGSKPGQYLSLTAPKFMKEAQPLKLKIDAEAYEFSTGSFGWEGHKSLTVMMCGMTLSIHVNLNAPIRGSKPKGSPSEASDLVLARLGPQSLGKASWDTIGKASIKDKDDLKKIAGIGPFIEKRLNKIGLYTFKQISRMTPQIEKEVTKAIVYFPGRHRRDDWAGQAKEFVKA